MKYFSHLFFLITFFFCIPFLSLASTSSGTIDNTLRYAWSENTGWIDFGSAGGAVTVTDSALGGYAYGENIGWLLLSSVTNNAEGTLSGYAWSENTGWIDFSHVTIDSSGVFGGYAYGENIGNIIFNSTTAKVSTDWRPASSRVVAAPTTKSGSRARSTPVAIPTATVTTPTPPTTNVSPVVISRIQPFVRNLTVNFTGSDVQSLQKYLNSKGFTVALSGPGSPGNETINFGNLTRAALAKFQKANNISPPVGFLGPITRSFITNNP